MASVGLFHPLAGLEELGELVLRRDLCRASWAIRRVSHSSMHIEASRSLARSLARAELFILGWYLSLRWARGRPRALLGRVNPLWGGVTPGPIPNHLGEKARGASPKWHKGACAVARATGCLDQDTLNSHPPPYAFYTLHLSSFFSYSLHIYLYPVFLFIYLFIPITTFSANRSRIISISRNAAFFFQLILLPLFSYIPRYFALLFIYLPPWYIYFSLRVLLKKWHWSPQPWGSTKIRFSCLIV